MRDMEEIISSSDISDRVKELGKVLTRAYANRRMFVVGVLNGAFIFTADLVRQIKVPIEVDFVRIASYGSESTSSGNINLTKDIELDVSGKDILIVEDIVDTGQTLYYLKKHLVKRNPASIRVCSFIDKKERREVDVQVDYVGFEISEGFVVGYGLDYAEQYRHYPAVYHLKSV